MNRWLQLCWNKTLQLLITTFVLLKFDSMKHDIRELREENFDLKRCLEFSQFEKDSLKKLQPDVYTMQIHFNKHLVTC